MLSKPANQYSERLAFRMGAHNGFIWVHILYSTPPPLEHRSSLFRENPHQVQRSFQNQASYTAFVGILPSCFKIAMSRFYVDGLLR